MVDPHARIILASASPRRKDLLQQVGLPFVVVPSGFDESRIPKTRPETYVQLQAEEKAGDVARLHPADWVIGADTVVCIDGEILGKPGSLTEARSMLRRLSGRTHRVHTGFCVRNERAGRKVTQSVTTRVRFKDLSAREIDWYVNTWEPFDKAGAYAIQGLGTVLVQCIHGSYTNVVGLPVCEVVSILVKEGIVRL